MASSRYKVVPKCPATSRLCTMKGVLSSSVAGYCPCCMQIPGLQKVSYLRSRQHGPLQSASSTSPADGSDTGHRWYLYLLSQATLHPSPPCALRGWSPWTASCLALWLPVGFSQRQVVTEMEKKGGLKGGDPGEETWFPPLPAELLSWSCTSVLSITAIQLAIFIALSVSVLIMVPSPYPFHPRPGPMPHQNMTLSIWLLYTCPHPNKACFYSIFLKFPYVFWDLGWYTAGVWTTLRDTRLCHSP